LAGALAGTGERPEAFTAFLEGAATLRLAFAVLAADFPFGFVIFVFNAL
jgi:hypothetical protein